MERRILMITALLALVAAPTLAQESKPHREPLGLDLGIYLPAAAKTKALFGDKWTSFGPGIGSVAGPTHGGFRTDFDVLMASRNGNRAMIIPIGVEYRLPIFGGIIPIPSGPPSGVEAPPSEMQGKPPIWALVSPYLSFGASAYATQLKVDSLGIASKWRGSSGFTGAVGLSVGERAFAELRYRTASKVHGLDIAGGQLRLGLRF